MKKTQNQEEVLDQPLAGTSATNIGDDLDEQKEEQALEEFEEALEGGDLGGKEEGDDDDTLGIGGGTDEGASQDSLSEEAALESMVDDNTEGKNQGSLEDEFPC